MLRKNEHHKLIEMKGCFYEDPDMVKGSLLSMDDPE
jgi:hypothetical protein